MNLVAANALASLVTYLLAVGIAVWHLVPALRRRSVADGLMLMVVFHAFRHVAMQIFSASEIGGLDAPDGALRTIAYGDLATATLALVALWALRLRLSTALALTWLVAVGGTVDLVSATITGVSNDLLDTASDFSWFILAFYVPFLWVTAVLLFWQLISRRHEPLDARQVATHQGEP